MKHSPANTDTSCIGKVAYIAAATGDIAAAFAEIG